MTTRAFHTTPIKGAVLVLLLGAPLALSACERREPIKAPIKAEAPVAAAPAPPATPVPAFTPEQELALAFRAAWGGPPPQIKASDKAGNDSRYTYKGGKLTPLGGDAYAFISSGQGEEYHAASGALSIHYLKKTPQGFERTGAWPNFLTGGSWGAAPDWKIRNDLMPGPALITTAGGTWQGYSCGWTDVVELTPQRPILRAETLRTSYEDASKDEPGPSYDSVLEPGEKGRTFRLRYDKPGDKKGPVVTYARVGEVYDPVSPPDMPWC